MTTITQDDDIRGGSPRIEGTRITIMDIKRRVIDHEEDPHVVAGEYDISMSDLFTALAYYYDHREAFAEQEQDFATARLEGERRTQAVLANDAKLTEQAE